MDTPDNRRPEREDQSMKREYIIFTTLIVLTVIAYAAGCLLPGLVSGISFPEAALQQLFFTILVITITYTIFMVLDRVFRKQITDDRTKYTATKVLSILEILLMLIAVAWIWVKDPQSLIVFFGIIGAGIAIALQDVFKNFAGSVIIMLTSVYSVGDRIQIENVTGDVIDIGIMQTTLLELRGWVEGDQATGRLTIIPNGKVISSPVNNFTKDHSFLWDEIEIPVTYSTDWRRAIEILDAIAKQETEKVTSIAEQEISRIGERYYLPRWDIEPAVYATITDNWVNLSLRYVTYVKERRIMRAKLNLMILEAFSKENIEISSTTQTVTVVRKNRD
jgi:small-conductance mechanosensitive channel